MGLFDLFKKKDLTEKQAEKKETIKETVKNNNAARTEMYQSVQAESNIFSGYRFVSTLSSNTCLACGVLDGKVFDSPEMPNVCMNEHCRCLMVPVVKGMEKFDKDDTRASEDGPVPASMTYEKWLKKQPAKIKREILGDYYDKYRQGTTLEEIVQLITSNKNQKES